MKILKLEFFLNGFAKSRLLTHMNLISEFYVNYFLGLLIFDWDKMVLKLKFILQIQFLGRFLCLPA